MWRQFLIFREIQIWRWCNLIDFNWKRIDKYSAHFEIIDFRTKKEMNENSPIDFELEFFSLFCTQIEKFNLIRIGKMWPPLNIHVGLSHSQRMKKNTKNVQTKWKSERERATANSLKRISLNEEFIQFHKLFALNRAFFCVLH